MIWLGHLEWRIRILKRKWAFLNESFVFCSADNVGDFCSFKDYGAGANRPKIHKFVKNSISHFRSNKMHFCNQLGKDLNILEYKDN